MGTFEVWTTGGGYYLADIFNFLAMFTSGSAWMDFLTVGIVLGVIFMVVRIAVTGSMEGVFAYLVMMAVVGGLSVGPKARVIVMDSTYPLEIYQAVDNVPYSVAAIASFTSRTSYHLTRRMETLLSTPDNLVYQEHGMLFGASLMSQAARWRAVTPTIHEKMVNFMENCVIDATNIGHIDLNDRKRFLTGPSGWFLEVPGHEFVDARCWVALGDSFEGGLEIGVGFDAVELAGFDQRGNAAPGPAAFVMTGEERVFAIESNRSDCPLDHIAVHLDGAVVEEELQPVHVLCDVGQLLP